MSFTHLVSLLQNKREELLRDWMREQTTADTVRTDLLDATELREDSSRFLDLLAKALHDGGELSLKSLAYEPVKQLLQNLSDRRAQQGFTPSEVATFIFSLKQPLFAGLKKAHGADAEGLVQELWSTTVLLDKLGLHTTELFQQTREEIIRRQQEEMLELSTPVVQLWKGIVALPLIGTLDSARTSVVMESLLQTIVETGSEIAIVDITGVPTVDTLVAQHLLKTVAAARLMGADCIISGIRPQIAQTMVHLQIDLGTVSTRATMADALLLAMKRVGFRVEHSAEKKVAAE